MGLTIFAAGLCLPLRAQRMGFAIFATLSVASGFVAPRQRYAPPPLRAKTRGESPLEELEAYWAKHETKWKRPLSLLDVRAAWNAGELDGILPSGRPSRGAADARLISVAQAVELYDRDELSVRRRFRNATPSELAPRFERVVAARTELQRAGKWAAAVVESEKRRRFERAVVEGDVEDEDASPAASRAAATLLAPVLKAAAGARNKADGGALLAMTTLQDEAGDDVDEKWVTAALLADLESEVAAIAPREKPAGTYSQAADASRDAADGNEGALLGVGLALVVVVVQTLLGGGGGGGGGGGLDGFPTI